MQHSIINYTGEQPELLSSLIEKRQEAKEYLRELRKMYNSLKVKVKRFEKKNALLNEEKDKMLILFINHNVQLALNKFQSIDKNIRLGERRINQLDNIYKTLSVHIPQHPFEVTQKQNEILIYYNDFRNLMRGSEDDVRIANKHLKKVDDHLALVRKYRKRAEFFRLRNMRASLAEPAKKEGEGTNEAV